MDDEDDLSLGERLHQGVLNLWREVNNHGKVLDHHGQEIEALRAKMNPLEKQVRGLKSSRGKTMASNTGLKTSIVESEDKLCRISEAFN